ncbi:hypothetical protein K7X08_010500 [Anisodus acutangulus]|uniref:Uncharacterized protein n=1 Tax=Anisodus acutangulus TaxID=402998 RepID=A0A9Q1N1G9_9SOLA|nr:hypothetical protein K7X08_010500 [Anisodus acutangulus]
MQTVMIIDIINQTVLTEYYQDTQHASKALSKLEEEDTQSEDIGGIGTSRSGKSVQVEHEGLQHRVEKMKESLMALVSYVEGEQLRRSEKAKKKQEALKEKVARPTAQVEKPTNVFPMPTIEVAAKGVPAQVNENVVLTGEAEKAKDELAKVVENASDSSQADVEFDSTKVVMGVVAQINGSGNN